MQRMESRRVSFSLDISEKPMAPPLRTSVEARPKTKTRGRYQEQISNEDRSNASSSIRLFQYLRSNITRAIRLVSKKQQPLARSSSNMVVPQQFVPHRDSHHSEALEECIEFINSSCRKSPCCVSICWKTLNYFGARSSCCRFSCTVILLADQSSLCTPSQLEFAKEEHLAILNFSHKISGAYFP